MRQRLTERSFEQGLDDLDVPIYHQTKLLSWTEDQSGDPDYPVLCTMEAVDGSSYEVLW